MKRAIITYRLRKVRSAVPGCALKLSAAPPTTIVIACPAPFFRMFEQDALLTEHIPSARRTSRYNGIRKFEVKVRRWGTIPGKASEKPVAKKIEEYCQSDVRWPEWSYYIPSVANVHIAPIPMIPCGWYPNTYGRSGGRSQVWWYSAVHSYIEPVL